MEKGEGDEEECEEEGEEEMESVVGSTGARPRRMSEIENMPNKVLPIPNYSSFFIFSPTNRWVNIYIHFMIWKISAYESINYSLQYIYNTKIKFTCFIKNIFHKFFLPNIIL